MCVYNRDELPSVGENGKEEEEEEGEAEEANGRHGVEEEEVGGKGKEDPIGHRRLPELSKYLGDADRLVLRDIQARLSSCCYTYSAALR